MKKKIQLFLIALIAIPSFLSGQTEDELGNWLMYFGTNKIADKWSIHTEVQYRNHKVAPVNIEQLLLRTGINYHVANNAILTFGYGHITSHDFESEQSGPESTEHRIFQQLILTNKVSRLKFEHRYRLEQRWVNSDYRNRIRYRLMVTMPINKETISPGAFFIGLYDEIFVNTEQTFFDRNRLYAALGYQINPITQVQMGYLRQRVNSFGKNYLQFAVVFNPDLRKEESN